MIREFYDYWSEPTRSGNKMRFEQQPTWELSRRLATWAKNQDTYKNGRISMQAGRGGATTAVSKPNDRYANMAAFIGQRII